MNYPAAGFPNETKKAVRILCPLCGRIHVHEYGETQLPLYCDKMFIKADDTYSIVLVEEPFPEEAAKGIDEEVHKYQKIIHERLRKPSEARDYYIYKIEYQVMQARELNHDYVSREVVRRSFNELRGRSDEAGGMK